MAAGILAKKLKPEVYTSGEVEQGCLVMGGFDIDVI